MSRIYLLLLFLFIPSVAYCQAASLSVEVVPNEFKLAPGEKFKVNAKITNNSNVPQIIRFNVCPGDSGWGVDSSFVDFFLRTPCTANALRSESIAPGESFDKELRLYLLENTQDKFTFKLKFSNEPPSPGPPLPKNTSLPAELKKNDDQIWNINSNPITITVDKISLYNNNRS